MTSLRPRADHQEAVSRRLASLTAELAATRPEERPDPEVPDEPWMSGHTRIRPLRSVPDRRSDPRSDPPQDPVTAPLPAPDPPLAPGVPVPGRHAARRRATPVLPDALRGRLALGPSQLVVVAVLVALGLAVTGWWLVRGDPERIEAPLAPRS